MAVQITKQPRYVEVVRITMEFEYADCPGAGISVNLTLTGEPVEWTAYEADEDRPERLRLVTGGGPLNPVAAESLRAALDGERNLVYQGVEVYFGRDQYYAEGRCPCGGHVDLVHIYDNPCSKCWRTYAKQGWEMALPEHRGEEIAYGMEDEALETERLEATYVE